MNLQKTLALTAATVLLAVLTTNPEALPAAGAHSQSGAVTQQLVYPDGTPALDATVVAYLINHSNDSIRRLAFKPDHKGFVTLPFDPSKYPLRDLHLCVTSPKGFGFWNFAADRTSPKSIVEPFTSVRVRLIDPYGKPIPGVKLCPREFDGVNQRNMWDHTAPSPWMQTTDADGYATLPNLPQSYHVILDVLDDRFAPPNDDSDIVLSNTPATPDATVQVIAGGSISGNVQYADTHKPAAGIQVEAEGSWPVIPVTTDQNGDYTIHRLLQGKYHVVVTYNQQGFSKWTSLPHPVDISPGASQTGIDLLLIHGGIVNGKVTNGTTGKPMRNFGVSAFPNNDICGETVMTDRNGNYRLRVPSCNAGITTLAQGTPGQQVGIEEGSTKTINFHVSMPPIYIIRGVVQGPDNKPVPNAEVVCPDCYEGLQTCTTNARGRFTLDASYFTLNNPLEAHCGSLSTDKPIFYNGEREVVLHLQPNELCTLEGQINDQDGNPVPNAPITLTENAVPNRGADIDHTTSDAKGQFKFTSVFANSTYFFHTEPQGYTHGQSASMTVGAHQNAQFPTLVVGIEDSFAGGIVLTDKGVPIVHAIVHDSENQESVTATDETGHFLLKGVPRKYTRIVVHAIDGSFGYKGIKSGSLDNAIYLHPYSQRNNGPFPIQR